MGQIEAAIKSAQSVIDQPSIICCKTIIGYGMPTRQGTQKAHSDAPGPDEVRGAKINLGADPDKFFYVPDDVLQAWRATGSKSAQHEQAWNDLLTRYKAAQPDLASTFMMVVNRQVAPGWDKAVPVFN